MCRWFRGAFDQIDGRRSGPRTCLLLKRKAHRWLRYSWRRQRDPDDAPKRYAFAGYD